MIADTTGGRLRTKAAGMLPLWPQAALSAILLLAAYLRFDFISSVAHRISHDTVQYDLMVRQLLERGVYGYMDTFPNARVTPGYPLFMAAMYVFADYRHHDPFPLIRYAQALMSVANVAVLYLLVRRLGGQAAALIAALAAAVYPPFVWTTGAVLTETPAALLSTLYVYVQAVALERQNRLGSFAAGIVIGLTVLTRPEFLPLLGASYFCLRLRTRKTAQTLKLFACALLGAAVVLSPWVMRNIATLHKPIVASTQVNPFAAGTYPDKDYDDDLVDRQGKTQMEVAKERLLVGFSTEPWIFLKWYTVGKLKLLYGGMFFGSGHSPLYPVIPLRSLFHLAIVTGGAVSVSALLLFRRQKPAALPALLLVVITVIRLAFVPEFRYNFTAMPLLIAVDCCVLTAAPRALAARLRGVVYAASKAEAASEEAGSKG